MRRFSKVVSVAITMVLMLSLFACKSETVTATKFKAGTYTGTAKGMGDMEVAVTVDANSILDIKVVKQNESPGISDPAFASIPADIVKTQSLGVDMVSGATVTSTALLAAVTDALKQAGGNIEDLSKPVVKETAAKKDDLVIETDVVVIGAGGAGLVATVSAIEKGAKVVVLEKMPMIGGNTMRAEGTYNTPDPVRQEKQGIEDSPEKYYEDTLKGGDNLGDPSLVRVLADNALAGLEWMESYGLKFKDEVFTAIGGIWKRGHAVAVPAGANVHGGASYIQALADEAKAKGAKILLDTTAEKLIYENGEVVGVTATQKDGTKVTVRASKGVIIATGGFSANADLASQYDKRITPTMKTSNAPSSTGDGIFMAEEIGASTVGMEKIQVHPLGDPVSGSVSGFVGNWFGVENYVFVNKEGKRFVSESERRDVIANGILEQTEDFMYLMVDSSAISTDRLAQVQELVRDGKSVEANSIEELAEKINVDVTVLKETIAKYNASVDAKVDVEFGKNLFNKRFETAPFYASVRVPTIHHTMGGLKIDTSTHVLDANSKVIPGLYAAGEVTGGIHGGNRLGGNAFPDLVVFGRIAGQNAAESK